MVSDKGRDLRICFTEEDHSYIREDGEVYTSVSAVIDGLKKKKDWEAQCKKSAKLLGISAKELQAKWDEKRLKGTQAGTILHEDRENYTNSLKEIDFEGIKLKVMPSETKKKQKWSKDIKQLENNSFYTELMIYDHKRKICGQADEVVIKRSKIYVLDFKTDAVIKKKGYMGFNGEEKLLYPCDHLGDCNFNTYSLKMSLYMYMLWKSNPHFKIGKLLLKHINIQRDDEGIPVLENGKPIVMNEEIIEVPYRRKEIEAIIKNYGV